MLAPVSNAVGNIPPLSNSYRISPMPPKLDAYGAYCNTPLRHRSQCLTQIGDQVVGVFDADRDADQAVGDADLAADLRRNRGVGHERRRLDERFDAAEALAEREEARFPQDRAGGVQSAADLERKHAAEAAHLSAGQVVL